MVIINYGELMDFKKLFNLTGKGIVDLLIVVIILFAILTGVFYAAGLVKFSFDTNDLMMMAIALVVAIVVAFLLKKKFGQPGMEQPVQQGAAPSQPAPQQPQPQPQQPQPAPQQPQQ